ncbi:hypothetical protein MNBD_GAMMA20-554 [hydrothermal vent metagenome]|uniref:Uncharacterized protein n=1 Tax=hydrothermal vent metagenome TaxID=652676 RepID=A0A3B1AXY2_9ZZZZ
MKPAFFLSEATPSMSRFTTFVYGKAIAGMARSYAMVVVLWFAGHCILRGSEEVAWLRD